MAYSESASLASLFDKVPFQTSSEPAGQNKLKEYESASVQKTLDNQYVPKPILDARLRQDTWLVERFQGQPLRIADIGCGDGYHGEIFASACDCYHGFEISSEMAHKTRVRWGNNGLKNAAIFEGDAGKAVLEPNSYDVAWSLYFTPGNFREELDDIRKYDDAYLNQNPAFVRVISNFHNALRPNGRILLTVYKDKPETEEAQRTFYTKTGQTLITPKGSRFVATKENFWSVRWTKESMLFNLKACGIEPEKVQFHDLNEISWIVEIGK